MNATGRTRAGGGPRVIIAMPQPPLPEGGAHGRCALAQLRGLQANGVDVVAVVARRPFAAAGAPPPDLPQETIVVAPETGWRARLGNLQRPLGELGRGAFAARVRELARAADVLHLEEIDAAWCSEGVAAPAVVQLNYLVDLDRPPAAPWRRAGRERLALARAERAALRRHGWLLANSPLVADELRRRAPHAEIAVAPLCLDPDHYPPAALDGPPVAGFIGTATWPPTAAAVRRLLGEVWPLLRAAVPEARLRIAGRGMRALLATPPPDGVDIVGEVASAVEFLRGVSLLLYPIARGSGMKVKVLESLAVGLPVVTTTAGAEGIAAGDGAVIADADAALVGAAAEILRDERARRQRGNAARDVFLRRYVPQVATAPLVDLYRRMAGG